MKKRPRKVIPFMRGMRAPVVNPNYAVCGVCRKPVESEEIVDNFIGEPKSRVRVRAKCHGAEETVGFDLGTEHHDDRDLGRMMRSHLWFAPKEQVGERSPTSRDDEGVYMPIDPSRIDNAS